MNTQESKPLTKVGDYHGIVTLFSIILTGNRPVIFTRINRLVEVDDEVLLYRRECDPESPAYETANEHTTHAVRLHDPEALRIGLGELKTAFPNDLATLSDEECLLELATNKTLLIGKRVDFSIQRQMKKGIVQKGEDGTPYFNVRLRAVEEMTTDTAKALIDNLLTHTPDKDDPFGQK